RWSVLAASLTGATVILVPYSGLGLADALWAAAAGGSAMMTGWRWADYRALAAHPVPTVPDPAAAAERDRSRAEALIARLPGGREALAVLRREMDHVRLRRSAVASGWRRLDRAAAVLNGLAI